MLNKLLNKIFHSRRTAVGQHRGRRFTRDTNTAIQFRMKAGFAGDVNRVHPANIDPCLVDAAAPPTIYGQPVIIDATSQGVRPFAAGDTAVTDPWGFLIRPYPISQDKATASMGAISIGAATPPAAGAVDVLRSGYIMAKVNGATVKGGAVYVWCAASAAPHVQGQLESAASGGNTAALANCFFNGVADANGVVEVIVKA